jgi:hypothetical protein
MLLSGMLIIEYAFWIHCPSCQCGKTLDIIGQTLTDDRHYSVMHGRARPRPGRAWVPLGSHAMKQLIRIINGPRANLNASAA